MVKCRSLGENLTIVLDLGKQPLGNGFLTKEQFKDEYFFEMKVGFSENSKLLQLIEQPDPGEMFHGEYAFFSSTSKYMAKHFEKWAEDIKHEVGNKKSTIVEIGCNDGIFLHNFVSEQFIAIGLEPSKNVADIAATKGIEVVNDFATEEVATQIIDKYGKADYITAANVICHIPDINALASTIKLLLKDGGKFIFEEPYLGDIVEKCSYDQIYDEHVFLFSCLSVSSIFSAFGLELINAEHQTTHGGSMRYTLAKKGKYTISDAVENIIAKELADKLDKIETMLTLGKRIEQSRKGLVNLMEEIKSKGHNICGYAATSKSTTILNYCNIGGNIIDCIYDTTPLKQGKFSPGMHIPVKDWKYFEADAPDYSFLFAWNHAQEIMSKEKNYTRLGKKWITHVPLVSII